MQSLPPRPGSRRPAATALAVLTAASLVAAASPASADVEPDARVGAPIGNLRYRTAISPADDRDDFVGTFVEGDRLTVTVEAQRGAHRAPPTLRPRLVLVDPAGAIRTKGVTVAPSGAGAALTDFRIDVPGAWAVRVSGDDGTTGEFVVSFRVRAASAVVLRDQRVGEGGAPARSHAFQACAGARLDATITTPRRGAAVEVRALTGPDGADVLDAKGRAAAERVSARGGRLRLTGVVLPASGAYALEVGAPDGAATYELSLVLRAPRRPSSGRVVALTPHEPRLDAVADAPVAEAGDVVRLTGEHLSVRPPVAVLFGGVPSPSVAVSKDGRTVDALVPPRAGPAVVAVAVVNPDRQGTVHARRFAYVPAPRVTDLVDAWTGEPVRALSPSGGRAVRLLGAHFEPGLTVRVAGATVTSPQVLGPAEVRFTLPPVAADGTVVVADPFQRSGASAFEVRVKTPPSFVAPGIAPGVLRAGAPATIVLGGADFDEGDRLWIGDAPVASNLVDATRRTAALPALAAGTYAVRLVDVAGSVVAGPPLVVKLPPVVGRVSVVAGDVAGDVTVPLVGGSTVQVDGDSFHEADEIVLGGVAVTATESTPTRKRFVAPEGAAGPATLTITDAAGQTTSVAAAVRYAGFVDVSETVVPAGDDSDDFTAARAVAADVDGDGAADDVVLGAPADATIGTRAERTRVLAGAAGALSDTTAAAVPAARSDAFAADTWDAASLVVADLDGRDGADVVLVGVGAGDAESPQVRVLANDGTGRFALAASQPPVRSLDVVDGVVAGAPGGPPHYVTIYGPSSQAGRAVAVAAGDVDGDGATDLVVGTNTVQVRVVHVDPSRVDFTQSPPVVADASDFGVLEFLPGTRVYANRLAPGGGWADVSATSLPSAGDERSAVPPPGLHCRDLALGDVDGDGRADLVVAWDDPRTVSAYGLLNDGREGTTPDVPRLATRILLNAGGGEFTTDATSTRLPPGAGVEHWQADRLLLDDLDGDGDADLVLLASGALDRWTGKPTRARSALRLLRNDGAAFTDVTASALPAPDAATGDDLRGDALAAADVDGDGRKDLVVATRESLARTDGTPAPRLRVLFGRAGLRFAKGAGFSERPSVDTGEASDVVFVPAFADAGAPLMLLVGPTAPAASSRPRLRAWRWTR